MNLIFKVSQGLSLAATFNVSMWSLLFVFWDIYLTSITKTSTSLMQQLLDASPLTFKVKFDEIALINFLRLKI